MPKWEKLIWRILGGRSDTNIAFNDLRGLLLHLGFEEPKSYQVKQVRRTLSRYGLRGDDEDV